MSLPIDGWSNASGTVNKTCTCGTWKQHWLNYSGKAWPSSCAVKECFFPPTLGGHVQNPGVVGILIAPLCDSCNGRGDIFMLKGGVALPSANQSLTCAKRP